MGQIPAIRRVLPESYKDLPWMPRLAATINVFMEQTIGLLNRRLTFKENFESDFFTITADGQYPIKWSWGLTNRPQACWIGQVVRDDGSPSTFTTAVYLNWRFNEERQIEISDIIGLDDSNTKKYNVTIIGVTG